MDKALTGVQLLLIVIAIAWIGAGVFFGIWFAIRAACRKLGFGRGYQILIPSGVCAIPFLLWLAASVDRLGPLETSCRAALLKTTRMEGTKELRVREHYDFWTKTNSGGGWVSPWISRPHETPKVSLLVSFERDQRPHSAWIDCVFVKVPNTGEPPQFAMQDVQVDESVLDRTSGGLIPWHPTH